MTAVFNFQYIKAYKISSSWKTLVDEVYSGGEQRRNLWTNPRKKWSLEFNKNSTDTTSILNFFDARKGRFEAFYWTWLATDPVTGKNLGGDDQQYLVRFDDDELNFSHLGLGYTNFSITFQEVPS